MRAIWTVVAAMVMVVPVAAPALADTAPAPAATAPQLVARSLPDGGAVAVPRQPDAKPTPTKKPKKTPSATPSPSSSATPTPVPDDPLIRNLLWVAGGVLGLMLLLFIVGGLRRRRPRR